MSGVATVTVRAGFVASRRVAPGLAVAIGAAAFSIVAPVDAQSRPTVETLDARLARVERVLDQSLLDQLQRVDALQQELRQLRGELEEANNTLSRLGKRSNDLYADTDRRVTELEEARASGGLFSELGPDGLPLEGGGEGFGGGGLDEGALGGASDTGAAANTGADSPGRFVSGRRSTGVDSQAIDVRSNATQAEKAAYTRAYDLLARGQNSAAVAEFDAFLEEYPDGPYSFNAWYWKGEAKYAERAFDEAIANFREVTEKFPTSTKVPDAQLKIGFSLYEQGDFAGARGILESVRDNFQGRSAAVLARKRLQKMDREGV